MKILASILCCCLPLKHLHLNSAYGNRIHPLTGQLKFHSGIDLKARNDTVYAVSGGQGDIGYDDFLGIYIKVHDGPLCYTYGHLSMLLVATEPVTEGEPIAITGATGRVTGEHLHFSISFNGQPIHPLKFLYQLTNHEQ
jgi:murein DD-endopeptidase MepM/ murein hydrolase activator NlpD